MIEIHWLLNILYQIFIELHPENPHPVKERTEAHCGEGAKP
jgi:hypothetical protein